MSNLLETVLAPTYLEVPRVKPSRITMVTRHTDPRVDLARDLEGHPEIVVASYKKGGLDYDCRWERAPDDVRELHDASALVDFFWRRSAGPGNGLPYGGEVAYNPSTREVSPLNEWRYVLAIETSDPWNEKDESGGAEARSESG